MSNSCARQSFGEKKEEKIDVLKYFVCVCLKIFKIIYLYSARNLSQVNKKKSSKQSSAKRKWIFRLMIIWKMNEFFFHSNHSLLWNRKENWIIVATICVYCIFSVIFNLFPSFTWMNEIWATKIIYIWWFVAGGKC